MNITFKNENSENNIEKAGRSSLENTAEIMSKYMNYGTDNDCIVDELKGKEFREARDFFYDHGSFYDYGLCVDYVTPDTFDDSNESYLRYQLSWGGPSSEIRFYYSPGSWSAYRIEYVFLDWFCGIGFDVTGEDWAQWLDQWFKETETTRVKAEEAMEEA